mmetsp:Transcript_79115/g.211433  ORF Transcript_79115/g.211433 Transcript_79115/m.211433 type:complete len:325 (+) Transcript_79115:28-1002(+)
MAAPELPLAQQLLDRFQTPEGLDVGACAAAALPEPSPEQIAQLEKAVDEGGQLSLLTNWLTEPPKEVDDPEVVHVSRLGSALVLSGVHTKQAVLEKLASEHAVYGRLHFEDGAEVADGKLLSRRLMLTDADLTKSAWKMLAAPCVWDNVITRVADLQWSEEHAQLLERIGCRLLRLQISEGGDPAGVDAVANKFQHLSRLQELDMDARYSQIGDAGAVAIASGLGKLEQLQEITMNFEQTQVGDAGVVAIASGLEKLEKLQQITMNFYNSPVGDAGAVAIASGLENLKKLQEITMDFGATLLTAAARDALEGQLRKLCARVSVE